MNLNRRFFLKQLIFSGGFLLYFFNIKNFFIFKKNKNSEILKNFYFAKNKYHDEITNLIFSSFLNNEKSFKEIVFNIEKRRKISNFTYKKNIKYLI